MGAVTLPPARNKCAVLGYVYALEISRRGDASDGGRRSDQLELGLTKAAAQHRNREPCARGRLVKRADENIAGFADQRIKHDRRPAVDNLGDDMIHRSIA